MTRLRFRSAEPPLDSSTTALKAGRLLAHLEAMGLLQGEGEISRLTVAILESALESAVNSGIPVDVAEYTRSLADERGLSSFLDKAEAIVEENPVPTELPSVEAWLGPELSCEVVGVSRTSLNRYLKNARGLPDDVSWRAHLSCLLIGDLAGSYNEIGMRRWFVRPRGELDGLTPVDWLQKTRRADDGFEKLRSLTSPLVSARSA